MNEQTNPSTEGSTATQDKAAYRYMVPKKKEPPVLEKKPEENLSAEIERENENADAENPPSQPTEPKSRDRENAVRRKRAGTSVGYADIFLNRYELSSRQGIHLEKETIATVKRIIHSIGDERLTASGFVENVLKHHFETYREEINRLFEEKLRKPID